MKTIRLFNTDYIPLRDAVTVLGGTVDWAHNSKQSIVELNGQQAFIDMEHFTVTKNGQTVTLSDVPLIQEGSLLVPLDFFPNVFGVHNPA